MFFWQNSRYLHGLNGVPPLLRLPARSEVPQGQSCANVAARADRARTSKFISPKPNTYKALSASRPVHGNEPG